MLLTIHGTNARAHAGDENLGGRVAWLLVNPVEHFINCKVNQCGCFAKRCEYLIPADAGFQRRRLMQQPIANACMSTAAGVCVCGGKKMHVKQYTTHEVARNTQVVSIDTGEQEKPPENASETVKLPLKGSGRMLNTAH